MNSPSPVLAAGTWPTNAALIGDVARLYLSDDDRVLDPTYGRGLWWSDWRPADLTAHDGDPTKSPTGEAVDFRHLPYDDGTFDAAAYDPPYVCVGGRKTTTIADHHDRYGLTDAPTSPAALQSEVINPGLSEVARVVRPKGLILVKCQDYISSGRLWIGTHHTLTHALGLGLEVVDRLEHVSGVRPQPTTNRDGSPRRQVHARRNLSTLFVLRRPRSLAASLPLGVS